MRIAFVSADATPLDGGHGPAAERGRELAALAGALAAAGHTVEVFTRRADLWSAPIVALAPNVNVVQLAAGPPHFVPSTRLPALMDDFAERFVGSCSGGEDYDVLHAVLPLSALAASRLRERTGIPFVVSGHDRDPPSDSGLAATADRVVAFDPGERERLIARYGAGSVRIAMVPAGVDTAAFAPTSKAARERFGMRSQDFVVVQRARLERAAGIDVAIRALAALKRNHGVTARLLVAADTKEVDPAAAAELARLRGIAAACGVAPGVTFAGGGPPAALREAYTAANAALVLPVDGSPAAPLEPMACGIPVVAADIGALRWAIQDEVTGYLVPAGDAAAVAERLARFHRNPELGRAYGRAGIRRVRAGHTWRHAAGELARLYASVLAPHHARLAAAASR